MAKIIPNKEPVNWPMIKESELGFIVISIIWRDVISTAWANLILFKSAYLKTLNIRRTGLTIISCPSCARQQFDVIKTVKQIENKFSWVKDPISVSILGCVVNGPGEAMHTDLGVTGGGNNNHQIYINGEKNFVSKNKNLVEEISILIEKKISKNE